LKLESAVANAAAVADAAVAAVVDVDAVVVAGAVVAAAAVKEFISNRTLVRKQICSEAPGLQYFALWILS
jgi:hypothetical protein